jgi:hypothetical protein
VGTAQYSTGAFAVVVEPDATANAIVPDSYDDEIQEYVRQYIEGGGIQLVQTVVDGDLRLSLA